MKGCKMTLHYPIENSWGQNGSLFPVFARGGGRGVRVIAAGCVGRISALPGVGVRWHVAGHALGCQQPKR
jgi:hypothetical protein